MGSLVSTVPIAVTSFARAVNRRVWVGRLLQALAVVLLAWAAFAASAAVGKCTGNDAAMIITWIVAGLLLLATYFAV